MDKVVFDTVSSPGTEGKPLRLPGLIALLGSRFLLFLIFQAVIAFILSSWIRSEGYWLLSATLTNLVSITILWFLFRREGLSYSGLFRFSGVTFKKDILIFLGLVLLCGPVVFGPNYLLSAWLWDDPAISYEMMFRPVDKWLAIVLLFAFPVTIVLAELATYFGYIMPRLSGVVRQKWLVVALPVLFLSLQHMTLPFIPDLKFILYRGLVFLPFAALIGIALYKRPTLFPYFAILHGVMDMGTAVMFVVK
ncbi:MAG: hypothetical protein LC630_05805 [Bacteroidales bacterium]|nr:hypothetical protein [Bacteroidales bacterium]